MPNTTSAYKWAKDSDFIVARDYSEWLTSDGLHSCMVSRPGLEKKELVQFCDNARREFYIRLNYVLFKFGQMIKHPAEAKRTLKSARTFAKYLFRDSSKDE